MARFALISSLVLLAACGGRSRQDNAGAGSSTSVPGDTDNEPGSGSRPSQGGSGASNAGTANVGGSAPAGTPGSAGRGSARTAGSASIGGSAHGGSTNGGSANGGAASVGGGAASGMPGVGGNGTDPAAIDPAIVAGCTSLCDAPSDCPEGAGTFGSTCQDDCVHAIAVEGAGCTDEGLDMAMCLTAALHDTSVECLGRFSQALRTCASSVSAQQGCAARNLGGAVPRTFCMRTSISDALDGYPRCVEDLKCLDGQINNLNCREPTAGQTECACFTKFSRSDSTLHAGAPGLCKGRFDECLTTGEVAP